MYASGAGLVLPVPFPPAGRRTLTPLRSLFCRGRMGPGISLSSGIDVGLDPVDAAPEAPHLISVHLGATPGYTRVSLTLSYWSHLGKIRYSSYNLTTSTRQGITSYVPGTAGTQYLSAVNSTGLTIGDDYRLDYWLDCIPNVAGYTETWYPTTIFWTQPDALSPPVDLNYKD